MDKKTKSIYSFDLGTSAWRIAHLIGEQSTERPSQILAQPVPVILNNFSNKGCLPVVVQLNTAGTLETYGQKAYHQLPQENQDYQWYENFKIGVTESSQSFQLTKVLLTEIIQQLNQEIPSISADNCIYLFSYPNHWDEKLIREFQQLVGNCLPEQQVEFISASQGLLLGVLNTGLVVDSENKSTLIIDLGDGTLDFAYGAKLTKEYQELELISFPNQNWFDKELTAYLAERLSISVSQEEPCWFKLKQYARQLKESFSQVSDPNYLVTMNLTLSLNSDQIISQSIQLTFKKFEQIITPALAQIKEIFEQFFQENLASTQINQIILTGGGANYSFVKQLIADRIGQNIPVLSCEQPERVLVFGTALSYVKNLLYPFTPKGFSENGKQAEIYNQQAITAIKQDNYQAAIDYLNQALVLKPDYREAYFNRSQVRYQLQDYQGSINDLEVTINMNPQDNYAYYRLGSSLLKQGNYRQALSSFTQALQKNPNLVEAYFKRGISQYYLGNLNYAKQDINEAINLSPKLVKIELNNLKKENRHFLGWGKNKKIMDDLIKLIECLLESIGVKTSEDNRLTGFAETLKNLVKLLPVEPETINVLTYKESMEYFVLEKPLQPEEIKGALLKQTHPKGYLIIQVFLDANNELVCRQDGSPYGRKLVAKNLDNELLENFGNTSLIIVTK